MAEGKKLSDKGLQAAITSNLSMLCYKLEILTKNQDKSSVGRHSYASL
jgi:hypothetical protein